MEEGFQKVNDPIRLFLVFCLLKACTTKVTLKTEDDLVLNCIIDNKYFNRFLRLMLSLLRD